MPRRIAVIGAGASGLTAAKAALECGLEPIIFETAGEVSGLWRQSSGFVWPEMRTNVSRWTCSFSDFPWADHEDDFPRADAVASYLRAYAENFKIEQRIRTDSRVTFVGKSGRSWRVQIGDEAYAFDGVIVASGVFSRPYVPTIAGIQDFTGKISHAARYRHPSPGGRRVAVVGASLSGIEIAAQLAERGTEVLLFFERAPWILPRYMPNGVGRRVPFDLMIYRRKEDGLVSVTTDRNERNRQAALFMKQTFGDPGDAHPALSPSIDGAPNLAAVSDVFLPFVRAGGIQPIRERVVGLGTNYVRTSSGRRFEIDEIMFCTGYRSDLSFLDQHTKTLIGYDPSDMLLPFLANKTVAHPDVKGLYFVGLYKGPYFGVMELQARWAAMMLSGDIPHKRRKRERELLACENAIRLLQPRPQFPHSDYVQFADELALEIGAKPYAENADTDDLLRNAPVTPHQYRLSGPFANRQVAIQGMRSAIERCSS